MAQPPFDLVTWVMSLLIVTHFTLDLLYLKLNLDFYDAENMFKYDWLLFAIDVAIVVLIRMAFTTIREFANPTVVILNPILCFGGIYVLYVLWELHYQRCNPEEKQSPTSTTKHYIGFAIFSLCVQLLTRLQSILICQYGYAPYLLLVFCWE